MGYSMSWASFHSLSGPQCLCDAHGASQAPGFLQGVPVSAVANALPWNSITGMDSPPLPDVPHSRSLILSDLVRSAGRTRRSATTFTCGGETFVVNFPGDLH